VKFHVEKRPAKYGTKHSGGFVWVILDELGRERGFHWFGPETAEAECLRLEWESNLLVGQRGSALLTDVRSVRSKAWTAYNTRVGGPHTDEEWEMLRTLELVSAMLMQWDRTGRPPKYKP